MGRTHIVMVPGFGGFDALGELRYYTGITEIFSGCVGDRDACIHYFDNLPTAAVATRAKALHAYLAKRVQRNEIRDEDELVLVGHSTGGLDIRQVVETLDAHKQDEADGVPNEKLLKRIKRVVFLSVPQRGTNIADWVHANTGLIDLSIALLRHYAGNALATHVGGFAFDQIAKLQKHFKDEPLDIVEAARDVGLEIGASSLMEPEQRWVAAQARQAAADLEVWLKNMDADFFAIPDLMSGEFASPSPEAWNGIRVQTYATIGGRPFDVKKFDNKLREPLAEAFRAMQAGHLPGSDFTYRLCYAACCAGPFEDANRTFTWFDERRPTFAGPSDTYTPTQSDNDGIVNTASMFWELGETKNFLVRADHGDIIGHYKRVPAEKSPDELPRRFESFDLLKSASEFEKPDFEKVWNHVFDFALGG